MRTDDGHVLERESYWKDVLHPRSLGHKELTEPDLPAPMLKDLTRVLKPADQRPAPLRAGIPLLDRGESSDGDPPAAQSRVVMVVTTKIILGYAGDP